MSKKDQKLVILGKLGKPFGIHGELHAYLDNPDSTTLQKNIKVTLKTFEGQELEKIISNIRYLPNKILIQFKGHESPESAASLVGLLVAVEESQLPELEEGEFYLSELIDFEVHSTEGRQLGKIKRFYDNGAQSIIVIANGYRITEIPFVDAFVVSVDKKKKIMVINEPEFIE